MDFIPTTIQGLFDTSIQFFIPIYQRAYSWQKENWRTFLRDIREQVAKDNEYSYGSLLLEIQEKDKLYDVIDGQQRLTTLVIFMRALYNILLEKGADKEELEEIEEFFKKRGKTRLHPVDNDKACFDAIIIENKEFTPTSGSQVCIANAKDFFTKELAKENIDTLWNICRVVQKSKVNRLELQGKKEAALMFELQNNRGKSLTNMEKLKSYFMYQMYVNSPAEETDENVENVSNNFKVVYSNVYGINGIDEDSLLIYHCYANLKVAFGYRNLDNIKNELENSDNKIEWIKDFSRELANTSANLRKLQDCKFRYYKKLLRLRGNKGMPAFVYPFIIKGYKYLKDDSVRLERLFHTLEILTFRYYLISSRADLNSRLSDALRSFDGDVDKLNDNIREKLNDAWYWGDERVKQYLPGWMYENPVLHYVLWEYEESLQGKGYVLGDIEESTEQIEHISPQTPTDGKPIETGYDVDENNKYSDEFVSKYLNCLGNLMLISGPHNASIGNKPFAEKLATYSNNPIFRQQAEIKDFVDKEQLVWKRGNIQKRLESILQFALKRWDFNSVK